MSDKFAEWIAQQGLPSCPAGLCESVTARMAEAFPELTRVRGHFVTGRKDYPHWWLITERGEIVDPTAGQFEGIPGFYEAHEGPEPTGKCPNCGGYIYNGGAVCGDECGISYAAYVMRGF